MAVTDITREAGAAGARLAPYRGRDTPFVLRRYCGSELLARCSARPGPVFDVSWQAKLVLSGEDRVRWLNGMVTNNIRDLALNHGDYNFVLNPQGRNLGDLVAYNRGDYLLVTTDREQAPKLAKSSSATSSWMTSKSTTLATSSRHRHRRARRSRPAECRRNRCFATRTRRTERPGLARCWHLVARSVLPLMDGYEIWSTAANLDHVWDALVAAGATPVGSEALELYRIARGVPRYGIDLRERDLPQETGQQHVLNFAKGCYVGQEIVERIHARGNVHRIFVGLEVQGDVPAVRKSKIGER